MSEEDIASMQVSLSEKAMALVPKIREAGHQ